MGVGAISVIRVSGPDSVSSVDKIFKGPRSFLNVSSHSIHYGKIYTDDGNILDDVLVSVFGPTPRTEKYLFWKDTAARWSIHFAQVE